MLLENASIGKNMWQVAIALSPIRHIALPLVYLGISAQIAQGRRGKSVPYCVHPLNQRPQLIPDDEQ